MAARQSIRSRYPLRRNAPTERASTNVAALGQITFVVFFIGPPVLGFVAEHFGIRFSYWAVLPVILAALFATKALRTTKDVEPAT